jgi:hypothetical protein
MYVFSNRMEHVMGELNYWTDLMKRWGVGRVAGSEHQAHGKMASLFAQPYITPPDYDTVGFPSKKEILLTHKSAGEEYKRIQQSKTTVRREEPPQQVDAGGMRMMNNGLWIPERAVELQLRSCVEAHCNQEIKENVAWSTMAQDFKVFVQNCLHCVATISGKIVPLPLGTQLNATKPNETLDFDFLYIELSRDGKY